MRTYITLIVFISIAIISFWLRQDLVKDTEKDKQVNTHFPDYFMENFTITNMNKQGQIEYELEATKMIHFDDDDTAELTQPILNFKLEKTHYNLTAKRAIYLKQQNIIHLYDDVVIQRTTDIKNNNLFIYTDYLKIDTQSKISETHLPARIKTAEAELNTTGLLINGENGSLILKSQVKGIYETIH